MFSFLSPVSAEFNDDLTKRLSPSDITFSYYVFEFDDKEENRVFDKCI